MTHDTGILWADTKSPALTPIRHLPWWSHSFFDTQEIAKDADFYYVDWEAVAQAGAGGIPLLRGDGRADAVWVTEIPDGYEEEADEAVAQLSGALGASATALPLLADGDAVEEHYVLALSVQGNTGGPFDPRAAWRRVVAKGLAEDFDPDGASLVGPEQPRLDQLYGMYVESMAPLSAHHPIEGVLDRDEFDQFALGDHSCMLALRVEGEPVSLALLSADPGTFGWIDERWIAGLKTPPAPKNVAIIPGIITRPERRMKGAIATLLSTLVELLIAGSTDISIVFPCNNLSRRYTPVLAQSACDDAYPRLKGAVELAARYIFRGYRVARSQPSTDLS